MKADSGEISGYGYDLGTPDTRASSPRTAACKGQQCRHHADMGSTFHLIIDRALTPVRADSADIRDNLIIDCAISAL